MKTNFTLSALTIAAVLAAGLSTVAFADNRGGMGGGMGGMEMGPMPAFDFATLDADKDGKVTQAELDAAHAARVAEVDANKDGLLSGDELAAMHLKMMAERANTMAAEMVTRMDTDGDKLLSAAEMAVRPGSDRMFGMIDADGDGAITQAEADAAKEKMAERGGRDGKGRHGKGHGQN
jgi:hypothetical protein